MPRQEDPVRVDARIRPEHRRRQEGIFNGLLPHGDGVLFVQDHFQAVGEAALVIADGRHAPLGKTLGDIPERGQFSHFFIHIAAAGAMDQHGGREGALSLGQGQHALERVAGVFSEDDGFLDHKVSSFV